MAELDDLAADRPPTDGLPSDGLPTRGPSLLHRARLLTAVAVGETLTLAALLINLAVVDDRAVAAALGPVHGGLYLAGVLLTWTAALPRAVKVLAVVPVLGAWVAVARAHRAGRLVAQVDDPT